MECGIYYLGGYTVGVIAFGADKHPVDIVEVSEF